MDEEQRLAVIGHELAHQVNGDLSHGLFVAVALNTLVTWHRLLRPGPRHRTGSIVDFAELLAHRFLWLLRHAVDRLYGLEVRLLFRSTQRAEYLADRLAAGIVGSSATIAAMDRLHLADYCERQVLQSVKRREVDLWAAERAYLAELPELEIERLRRLDARRGHAVDATHPPTHLRVEMLRSRSQEPGRPESIQADWPGIAVELREAEAKVTQRLRDRLGIQLPFKRSG
jgi:Zn-dependent protease with chaperone function